MSQIEVQRDAVTLAKILGKMKRVESEAEHGQLDICREAVEIVLGMYHVEDMR